jgi:hypothetical protein
MMFCRYLFDIVNNGFSRLQVYFHVMSVGLAYMSVTRLGFGAGAWYDSWVSVAPVVTSQRR